MPSSTPTPETLGKLQNPVPTFTPRSGGPLAPGQVHAKEKRRQGWSSTAEAVLSKTTGKCVLLAGHSQPPEMVGQQVGKK